MKRTMKAYIAVVLSLCMAVSGLTFVSKVDSKAATLVNAANGRNGYTFMTSNANTPVEGFLYVGNGFGAINCCNENLGNGNNLLGQNATTEEVAAYIDLGKDYDISNAKVYQGSTNANFYDSYCRSYKIYYSKEQVNKTNKGNIEWNLAGTCDSGTIYDAATTKIKSAEYKSSTGDVIQFENTVIARSVKLVFDKASCMGTGTNGNNTGTVGTVSLLSIQIYGVLHQEETTTEEITTQELPTEEPETGESDDTLYASYYDDVALKSYNSYVKGYASSNLRNGSKIPLAVNNLTNGNTTGTNYIIANTTGGDTNPWFAVDLGKTYDVNKVIVTPGADTLLYANAYPISYKIQVAKEMTDVTSASGIANLTWKTVATVTDGNLTAKSLTFARQNARYIRVAVDSYADYCSLYELSVYETDDSRLLGEEDDIMNVLFVGNSMTYYNTLCKVVEGFAKKQGKHIQCTESTAGGQNLIYHTTYTNTVSAIQSGEYDVVILQDIVGSFDGDRLMQGAEKISDMVREYNPDAKVMYYMPWPVKGNLERLLPYFTYNYIKAARTLDGTLAPAGEAYYTLYNKYPEIEWYCNDEKHPHAIGTFVSACSVYYALFPESERITIDSANAGDVNKIINDNISYSGDAVTQYDAALLNDISNYAYNYTRAVEPSVEDKTGKTKYVSVAGEYYNPDDEVDKEGLTEVEGEVVDSSVFTKSNGNIAVGCSAYASNEKQKASYATDENLTGTRWETEYEDPQWLYVDLGEQKNIEKVGFIWEGAYAKRYYIQISDNAKDWTTVAMAGASSAKTVQITLDNPVKTRYVRMYGTRRGSIYGYSFYEMGVWESSEEATETYKVTVDGIMTTIVNSGEEYTLGEAKYGYYADGKMYPAGYKYIVNSDVEFKSMNKLSVSVKEGAGIRTKMGTNNTVGLRFQANVDSDNIELISNESLFTTGMLITSNDIFENNNMILSHSSLYAKLNIINCGWYQEKIGQYCGSVVNISESNYKRKFIARAYIIVNYADGTTETVYSDMTGVRSAHYVANAVKNDVAVYEKLTDDEKAVIDKVAAAR